MPEGKSAPKRAKGSVEPSPEASNDSAPEAVHNLESHALPLREQLMRQWPTWDWETRLWRSSR